MTRRAFNDGLVSVEISDDAEIDIEGMGDVVVNFPNGTAARIFTRSLRIEPGMSDAAVLKQMEDARFDGPYHFAAGRLPFGQVHRVDFAEAAFNRDGTVFVRHERFEETILRTAVVYPLRNLEDSEAVRAQNDEVARTLAESLRFGGTATPADRLAFPAGWRDVNVENTIYMRVPPDAGASSGQRPEDRSAPAPAPAPAPAEDDEDDNDDTVCVIVSPDGRFRAQIDCAWCEPDDGEPPTLEGAVATFLRPLAAEIAGESEVDGLLQIENVGSYTVHSTLAEPFIAEGQLSGFHSCVGIDATEEAYAVVDAVVIGPPVEEAKEADRETFSTMLDIVGAMHLFLPHHEGVEVSGEASEPQAPAEMSRIGTTALLGDGTATLEVPRGWRWQPDPPFAGSLVRKDGEAKIDIAFDSYEDPALFADPEALPRLLDARAIAVPPGDDPGTAVRRRSVWRAGPGTMLTMATAAALHGRWLRTVRAEADKGAAALPGAEGVLRDLLASVTFSDAPSDLDRTAPTPSDDRLELDGCIWIRIPKGWTWEYLEDADETCGMLIHPDTHESVYLEARFWFPTLFPKRNAHKIDLAADMHEFLRPPRRLFRRSPKPSVERLGPHDVVGMAPTLMIPIVNARHSTRARFFIAAERYCFMHFAHDEEEGATDAAWQTMEDYLDRSIRNVFAIPWRGMERRAEQEQAEEDGNAS